MTLFEFLKYILEMTKTRTYNPKIIYSFQKISRLKSLYPHYPEILYQNIHEKVDNILVFRYDCLVIYFNIETGFFIRSIPKTNTIFESFFVSLEELEMDDIQITLLHGKKILSLVEGL